MSAEALIPDATGRELTQFLSYRIVRLHHALNAQAMTILDEKAGVTLTQWRVIAMIGSGTGTSSRDITRKSIIDPGLISRTVKTLEDRGLLTASRQDEDRRVVNLALTPKGQKVYDTTLPFMQARQAALIDALDPAEQAAIFRICDKLEAATQIREFGA